jgi:glycosyltransferase involved in cell wall biosynthesis
MRLLLVIDGMHPRDGGPPVVVAGSALALQAQGIEVTVLTTLLEGDKDQVLTAWQSLTDVGIKIEFCGQYRFRDILLQSDYSALIIKTIETFDVIHLHGLWNPVLIYIARLARKYGKPYLFSTHGVFDHRAMRRTLFKFLKKRVAVKLLNLGSLLRDASGVIFGSEAEAEQSWEIAPGMKKVFVPNGVGVGSPNQPISLDEKKMLDRIAPNFSQWERSLLYFARIHPEKGTDLLIQAFNIVSAEFPGAGLLIAGLKQDEVFQRKVEKLIAETPDPSRLIFTTNLTGAKSQFLYRICDCFVLPSHAEGFSVALIEALANGKPSLITRFCHMPILEHKGAGIIVDPTSDDLVKGLRLLLSMPASELEQMGWNAHSLYEENYTWSKVATRLVGVYSDAISNQIGPVA